jgi:hypothetical protein
MPVASDRLLVAQSTSLAKQAFEASVEPGYRWIVKTVAISNRADTPAVVSVYIRQDTPLVYVYLARGSIEAQTDRYAEVWIILEEGNAIHADLDPLSSVWVSGAKLQLF